MPLAVSLEPLAASREILEGGLQSRPRLSLVDGHVNSASLVLGRGSISGIADKTIGSQLLMISFDDYSRNEFCVKVTLLRDSDKSRVYINSRHWKGSCGEHRYLRNGDFLSLDNLRYEYRATISRVAETVDLSSSTNPSPEKVRLLDKESSSTPTPLCERLTSNSVTQPCETPASGVALAAGVGTRLSDEIQCAICLEIQVHSVTLVPCGHSFCAACVTGLAECPQCRSKTSQFVVSRQLDSLISTLVSVPGLLDAEDVQEYHERKKKQAILVRVEWSFQTRIGTHWKAKKFRLPFFSVMLKRFFYYLSLSQVSTPPAKRPAKRQRMTAQWFTQQPGLHPIDHNPHRHLNQRLPPFPSNMFSQSAFGSIPYDRTPHPYPASFPLVTTSATGSRRGGHAPPFAQSAQQQLRNLAAALSTTSSAPGGTLADAIYID